jgi:methylglutaconyl-CoA hydratase
MNTLTLHQDDRIALITLSRPGVRNAIDDRMIHELTEIARRLEEDHSVRGVVLTGAGRAFCSGMDLAYLERMSHFDEAAHREDSEALRRVLLAIRGSRLPWIAAVNGPAIAGGCGLATACDLILADRMAATFGYPEARIGFLPALVAPLAVARIGETHARDLLLSGRIIKADAALRMGLVNELSESGQVLALAGSRARQLARQCSGESIAATKALLHRTMGLTLERALECALEDNVRLRQSAACHAGLRAFLAKQEIDWSAPPEE